MNWRVRLAEWLAPKDFAELRALRSSLDAAKQHMALQIDLERRIAGNFRRSAAAANSQSERLFAMVFDRLTAAEKKQLDMGLPTQFDSAYAEFDQGKLA